MTLRDPPAMPTAKRVLRVLAAIVCLVLAGFAGFFVRGNAVAPLASADVSPTSEAKQTVATVDGVSIVRVDAQTQEHSGIRARQLDAVQYRDDAIGTAIVVDLQPLIDLHSRYDAAVTDRVAAAAQADAARRDDERKRTLYTEDQNVSLKVYQAAQASDRIESARAQAATRTVDDVRGALRTQFGDALTQWATDSRSMQFRRLLDHREVLLRVTAPLGMPGTDAARIEVAGSDARRQPADYVSRAQQADPALAGTGAIYRTAATPATANGARLVAYLPRQNRSSTGVVVPANALVWYGGQPWAYVQTGRARFARTPVSTAAPMNDGYFVQQGIPPGARVVVAGAQLLLSEELKPRATGTACKDPECD